MLIYLPFHYMPFHYCYEYFGNCFCCSGPFCVGTAEMVKDKIFWETYSYEDS